MGRIGKVERGFLEDTVYQGLGADRDDVRLGPGHGLDFGVIDVGDNVVAVAADPLFIPLELGVEPAAWYGFHIVVSDVALSGIPPSHLSITATLPPGADATEYGAVWSVFDEAARDADIAITTGHTGRYEGCQYPYIGGATALAVGDPDDLIVPSGANPGDVLIVTNGPAIETVGVLAMRFGDELDVDADIVDACRDRFWEMDVLTAARIAADTGVVSAMHDATERGLANACHELAAAADVGIDVTRDHLPTGDGVETLCDHFDIDPLTASSSGTVLVTTDPDDVATVLDAFEDNGIRAAAVGHVHAGDGVHMDGGPLLEPETDPFWSVYTELADGTE